MSAANTALDPVSLFQDNINLIHYFIQKYFPIATTGTFLYEELVAESRIALWYAALKYEPEKSKFSTYAGLVIYGYMYKYYTRVYKKQSKSYGNSLDFLICEETECSLGDVLLTSELDTESDAINNITSDAVSKAVRENEKYHILDLYFFQGLSQTKISKRLGLSQIQVSRVIRKQLESLKTELKLT